MQYRKRPVVVEAEEFDGSYGCALRIEEWSGGQVRCRMAGEVFTGTMYVLTLEGTMTVIKGDRVIKGVKGEFYPCKPDIFEATYEAVV